MIAKRHKQISLAFGATSALLSIAFAIFLVAHRAIVGQSELNPWVTLSAAISFTIQAVILTYKRPENRIGWLLMLVTLLQQTSFARTVAEVFLVSGVEPTTGLLFWFNLWAPLSAVTYSLLATIFVLFPDGRLLSPRWRPAIWALAVQTLVVISMVAYLSYDFGRGLAIARAAGETVTLEVLSGIPLPDAILHLYQLPPFAVLSNALLAAALVIVVSALASQVSRYRRGNPLERQQIKWVIFAMALWVLFSIPFIYFPWAATILDFIFVPIVTSAIAVPILRYRLYDIDFIIRRTLLYGVVTASLAAVYFGSVLLLQQLTAGVSGEQSPFVLVISTLFIAALFSPLRRRAQQVIDRRFYRAKVDRAQTLARFARSARDETDLDLLTAELEAVVQLTMQPESVLVWLRPLAQQVGASSNGVKGLTHDLNKSG